MECVICGSQAFKFKEKNSYNICKCTACGLDFCSPMPTEKELGSFYGNHYRDILRTNKVAKKIYENNLKQIVENFPITRESNILDYGCGIENVFISTCRDSSYLNSFGYDKHIIDETDETRTSWNTEEENQYDLITMWGVLEHLVDPIETLSLLKKKLSPKGLIIFTTVFSDTLIPFQYKPPEHTLYFTSKSLKSIEKSTGLILLEENDYFVTQDSDVYFQILLRTVPENYQKMCRHEMPEFVKVPTNEKLIVMQNN